MVADDDFLSTPVRMDRDASAFIVRIDGDVEGLLGWSASDLVGRPSTDFLHPQDQPSAITAWMTMIEEKDRPVRWRGRYRSRSGDWVWIQTTNTNLLDEPDHGYVATLMHAVESGQLSVEEQLRAREQLLHRLTDALPVGVVHFDVDGEIVSTNDRLHDIIGHLTASRVDDLFRDVARADRDKLSAAHDAVLDGIDVDDLELMVEHGAGPAAVVSVSMRPLTDADNRVDGVIATVLDVTERVQLRRRLEHHAATDDLTGCLNRRAIHGVLAEVTEQCGTSDDGAAVAYIDLDDFKRINDRFGHSVGDAVLVSVANRLISQVREVDHVGRVGGDEFLVVCPHVGDDAHLEALRQRVLQAVNHRIEHQNVVVEVSASVGVAHTDKPVEIDTLIALADSAMYVDKEQRHENSADASAPQD